MTRYEYKPYKYIPPPELSGGKTKPYPVVIIGAGPVGLCMAIDLALKGIACVILDDNDRVSIGSRAICWSKRTLEIFDRLGVGEKILDKGVTWKIGRVYHGDKEIYSFDLLSEEGHQYPAFVNLQQYYVEKYLIDRILQFPEFIDLRFKNKVINHTDKGNSVAIDVDTPDGRYSLKTDYLIACDGAGSDTRQRMGPRYTGQTFDEYFLIVDVEMPQSPFPDPAIAERWFWFEPTFHKGQSALLHKQPDNIYRIDLQLGFNANPEEDIREENVLPRLKAIFGSKSFKIDWMSIYKFRCARLEKFVHNRVIFAGDSAHVVSPFGARGGNGGVQDVDNLGWKLAMILKGETSAKILETYDEERIHGAKENILNSSRTTNFMSPQSPAECLFRAEVLKLSKDLGFARTLINPGRLSVPCSLNGFSLQTQGEAPIIPGSALIDAPLIANGNSTCLLREVQGHFTLVALGDFIPPEIDGVKVIGINQSGQNYACFDDYSGLVEKRYGTDRAYLFRPDAHVAAVFENPDKEAITSALNRAKGKYL